MVEIKEVKGNSRENRTAAHSHIKGLGLRNDGYADTTGAGFVGQVAAREVCYDGSQFVSNLVLRKVGGGIGLRDCRRFS